MKYKIGKMIKKKQVWFFCIALIGHLFLFISSALSNENKDIKSRQFIFNLAYGNGWASEGGGMNWGSYQVSFSEKIADNFFASLVYLNEGHPNNNYRDGFAVIGTGVVDFNQRIQLDFSVGPYFSMNTTRRNKQEYNDKRVGIYGSVAFIYYLIPDGFFLKAQYNHVQMLNSFTTDSVMVGFGANFQNELPSSFPTKDMQISYWLGTSQTNRANLPLKMGHQLEFKHLINDAAAYSVSYLYEGDNGLVNRQGVVGQIWYVMPILTHWDISAGIGPYYNDDRHEIKNKKDFAGVISLEINYQLVSHLSTNLRFNRVVSFNDKDQDMFMAGIAWNF